MKFTIPFDVNCTTMAVQKVPFGGEGASGGWELTATVFQLDDLEETVWEDRYGVDGLIGGGLGAAA